MTQIETAAGTEVDLTEAVRASSIQELLDELDRDLIGLAPVKTRIREIASLLLVARLREQVLPLPTCIGEQGPRECNR